MNVHTGEIKLVEDAGTLNKDWIMIDAFAPTVKQMETKQVSKYDNKSKLGIEFTGNRKSRREQERVYRKNNLK